MTQKEKQGGFANTFQMFAAKAIVGALSPSKRLQKTLQTEMLALISW